MKKNAAKVSPQQGDITVDGCTNGRTGHRCPKVWRWCGGRVMGGGVGHGRVMAFDAHAGGGVVAGGLRCYILSGSIPRKLLLDLSVGR